MNPVPSMEAAASGSVPKAAIGEGALDPAGLGSSLHRQWLAGLSNRRSSGPAPRLSAAQKAGLAQMVREWPDAGADGVVRWWRVDPKRRIEARVGVTMHERIAGKPLAGLGLRRLSVRPPHPKSGPEAEEAFKETSR